MTQRRTEQLHEAAIGLDALPSGEVAATLAQGQIDGLAVIGGATVELAEAGEQMARTLQAGRRLHYVAAGSSGLMAMADACELAGTFGIEPAQVAIHMAGGIPTDASMPGDTEDATADAAKAVDAMAAGDTALLLSASGSTPFVVEVAELARKKGVALICIANTPGSPLLAMADVAICLPTPPEVLAGSTRMGAGTAQKAALNIMSTIMGMVMGHVHDGMMVNVKADNAKLRARAAGMVATIAKVDATTAETCLEAANGAVKLAVLMAVGAHDLNDATARLSRADGRLRAALAAMTRT